MSKSSITIKTTENTGEVLIAGDSKELMKQMLLIFEKHEFVKEFFKDAIKFHDLYIDDREKAERNAQNN